MNEPIKYDRKKIGDILSNPDAAATVLHAIALGAYKDELYGDYENGIEPMDPVELWLRLKDDFHAVTHENNENKLNAIMLGVSSDIFYEDPAAFTGICMSLYDGDLGDMVDGVIEDLTVPEMLWGIYEIELNRDDQVPFSSAIVRLIDEIISQEADERFGGSNPAVLPYFEEIIKIKQEDMFEQMRYIGWPEQIIRRISMSDLTPRHNEQAITV